MSVGLYMDVHVPRFVTEGLRQRDIDVLTAQEDGQHTTSDPELLDRATVLHRVLVSQDQDSLLEAMRRQRAGKEFSGLAYAHPLRITLGQWVEDLELLALAADEAYMMNRIEWLPFT